MPSFYQLDFERPLRDLEARMATSVADATEVPALGGLTESVAGEVQYGASLEAEREKLLTELYGRLSPWDTVRVARHPDRPQTRDYIATMCRDFCELHGDRRYGDDPAIVTGFGRIGSRKCLIVGHQKGKTTQEKIACHFGCAHPEGYRKALAKMKLAEKFGVPIVTLVDTPGAYPGIGAEQRGQAEAIAVNLREMSRLRTPIVSVVIGEGGSGGALAIGVGDRVNILEYSTYSVISPEGCASILWKDASNAEEAATALGITSSRLKQLGLVDEIIPEPLGGAHKEPDEVAGKIADCIEKQLDELGQLTSDELLENRYHRLLGYGEFQE